MLNAKEVITAARAGEALIAEAAPGLSESVARSLPEIFGPAGKHSVASIEAIPGAGQALERISTQFQGMLQRFGLAQDAGPKNLFDAASRSGQHVIGEGGRSGNHVAGVNTITFDDGTTLAKSYGAGRSGATSTHTFRLGDKSASITEHHSNFFGRSKHTIGVQALDFRAEAQLAR
jgi:hypothetical protein